MTTYLVPAAWDIQSALANAKDLGSNLGAGLLALLGVVGIVVAIVFFFIKLLSDNSRRSWVTIISLFLLSGLSLTGGLALFSDIASGAQTTIEELGK